MRGYFYFFLILFSSCKVGFNKPLVFKITAEYSNVYFPSINDFSSSGGNSGRISTIIRMEMLKNSSIKFSSFENAKWGLDISVLEKTRGIEGVSRCDTGTTVGTLAFNCDKLFSFQPRVVAEKEYIRLLIRFHAIDLETGKTLYAKTDTFSNTFDTVSSDDVVKTELVKTPQLHGLRYVENEDNAISGIGVQVASYVNANILPQLR